MTELNKHERLSNWFLFVENTLFWGLSFPNAAIVPIADFLFSEPQFKRQKYTFCNKRADDYDTKNTQIKVSSNELRIITLEGQEQG